MTFTLRKPRPRWRCWTYYWTKGDVGHIIGHVRETINNEQGSSDKTSFQPKDVRAVEDHLNEFNSICLEYNHYKNKCDTRERQKDRREKKEQQLKVMLEMR